LPLTHVAWRDVTGMRDVLDGILFILIVVFVALLIRKLVRATPAGRRVVLPLAVVMFAVAAQFAVQVGLFVAGSSVRDDRRTRELFGLGRRPGLGVNRPRRRRRSGGRA